MDLSDKVIVDMGTGTGILAILCKMKGARKAIGIEIDKDAYDNACDNTKLNNVEIDLRHGDATTLSEISEVQKADLLIANINRNIVLTDMDCYVEALKPKGEMILSGFYEADIPLISRRAEMLNMAIEHYIVENDWVAVRLKRTIRKEEDME